MKPKAKQLHWSQPKEGFSSIWQIGGMGAGMLYTNDTYYAPSISSFYLHRYDAYGVDLYTGLLGPYFDQDLDSGHWPERLLVRIQSLDRPKIFIYGTVTLNSWDGSNFYLNFGAASYAADYFQNGEHVAVSFCQADQGGWTGYEYFLGSTDGGAPVALTNYYYRGQLKSVSAGS